jgi:DDE superfamily endonuclease
MSPPNITLIPMPAKCPELNPQENVWQFMRENWLSNRLFNSYDQIVDHCCDACNKLIDQPWRIMSIGMRDALPVLISESWYYLLQVEGLASAELKGRGAPKACIALSGQR